MHTMTDAQAGKNTRTGSMRGLGFLVLLVGGAVVLGLGVRAIWRTMQTGHHSVSQAEPTIDEIMADLDTYDAVVGAAREYLTRGKTGTAVAILDRALEQYPNEGGLHAMRGQALVSMDRKAAALEAFERACFVGPDTAVHRDFAATLAAELGRDDQAVAHWTMAQQLAPENPKYPLYRAQVLRRMGRTDEAKANLMLATGLDPSIGVAWATLAAMALDENKPEMTVQHIRRARELEPGNVSFRVIEAKALRRMNRAGDALTLLGAMDEADRESLEVVEEMALCLGLLGKPQEAAALYEAAVERHPQNGRVALAAAEWKERAGDNTGALRMAEHAAMLGERGAREMADRLKN
jgi:tetratricopeptide (TPR) repeat protein